MISPSLPWRMHVRPHPLNSRQIQPQIRRHRHIPSALVIGEPQICRHRHLTSTLVIVAGFSLKYSFPLPDEALQDREVALMMLMAYLAYLSYIVAELFYLSCILTVL